MISSKDLDRATQKASCNKGAKRPTRGSKSPPL
jgi:hypothetical protein